jgi:hypothetical protein
MPDREQSASPEQTMVEFATQSVASAESQYKLHAPSAGDDANWADELAGVQLVSDQFVADQLADVELAGDRPAGPDPAGPDPPGPHPAGPDPAGPDPDPAGAEFASVLRDSRYDTAS